MKKQNMLFQTILWGACLIIVGLGVQRCGINPDTEAGISNRTETVNTGDCKFWKTTAALKLRTCESTSCDVIVIMKPNTVVELIAVSQKDANWFLVRVPEYQEYAVEGAEVGSWAHSDWLTCYADGYFKNYQYDPCVMKSNLGTCEGGGLGLGGTACGLVAAESYFRTPEKHNYQLLQWLKQAAGRAYTTKYGIQPIALGYAMKAVFGPGNVTTEAESTISKLVDALGKNKIVIVDMLAGTLDGKDMPTVIEPNYAHFARVMSIDEEEQIVTLENTLDPKDQISWEVTYDLFNKVWEYPEREASHRPDVVDEVTRWTAWIDRDATYHEPSAYDLQCIEQSWINTCVNANTLLKCDVEIPDHENCTNRCAVMAIGMPDYCE